MRIFEPDRNPFLVDLDAYFLQAGSHLLLLAQQALRLNVKLFHLIVNVADRLPEGIGLGVKTLCFLVVGGCIGSFSSLFDVLLELFAITLQFAKAQSVRRQCFCFGVETFEPVAAHAASTTENFLACIEHGCLVEHQIRTMTLVTTCLHILFAKHRPQPMFVQPVSLLDTRRGGAVPVMARRASETLRIMNLEQYLRGMAGKSALASHVGLCDRQVLAYSKVARLTSVHQIHRLHMDLFDRYVKRAHLVLKAFNLSLRQACHPLLHDTVEFRP